MGKSETLCIGSISFKLMPHIPSLLQCHLEMHPQLFHQPKDILHPMDVGINGPLLLPTRGRCRPVGRGALHPQRCRGRKPLLQTAAASVRLPFLASLLHPPPHHVSWNHTLSQPCLRLGLKDAGDSALLCFSPCDKAGEGVTTFTCIWRGKAFLPLVEEDS